MRRNTCPKHQPWQRLRAEVAKSRSVPIFAALISSSSEGKCFDTSRTLAERTLAEAFAMHLLSASPSSWWELTCVSQVLRGWANTRIRDACWLEEARWSQFAKSELQYICLSSHTKSIEIWRLCATIHIQIAQPTMQIFQSGTSQLDHVFKLDHSAACLLHNAWVDLHRDQRLKMFDFSSLPCHEMSWASDDYSFNVTSMCPWPWKDMKCHTFQFNTYIPWTRLHSHAQKTRGRFIKLHEAAYLKTKTDTLLKSFSTFSYSTLCSSLGYTPKHIVGI